MNLPPFADPFVAEVNLTPFYLERRGTCNCPSKLGCHTPTGTSGRHVGPAIRAPQVNRVPLRSAGMFSPTAPSGTDDRGPLNLDHPSILFVTLRLPAKRSDHRVVNIENKRLELDQQEVLPRHQDNKCYGYDQIPDFIRKWRNSCQYADKTPF